MRKLLCPQCKIAGLYVKNEKKERLLVYVSDEGEVVPKNLEENMEGFDFRKKLVEKAVALVKVDYFHKHFQVLRGFII